MRTFTDIDGNTWQAAILHASFGHALLVFSRLGEGALRRGTLDAVNLAAAETRLAAMDETALRHALACARPWHNEDL